MLRYLGIILTYHYACTHTCFHCSLHAPHSSPHTHTQQFVRMYSVTPTHPPHTLPPSLPLSLVLSHALSHFIKIFFHTIIDSSSHFSIVFRSSRNKRERERERERKNSRFFCVCWMKRGSVFSPPDYLMLNYCPFSGMYGGHPGPGISND